MSTQLLAVNIKNQSDFFDSLNILLCQTASWPIDTVHPALQTASWPIDTVHPALQTASWPIDTVHPALRILSVSRQNS